MSRIVIALVFLLAPLVTMAQADRLMRRWKMDSTSIGQKVMIADSLLTRSYNKSNYDTAYIRRPRFPFTVKVRYNVAGSKISTRAKLDGHSYKYDLSTSNQTTASVALSYRGLSVAMAINPKKLFGKDKSKSFNFTLYANRYGMDLAYQDSRQYSGTGDYDGLHEEFTTDLVHSQITNMNAYYAFNFRRFSYPAALTQSYIQKRSAGSWLLALSLINGRINVDRAEEVEVPEARIRMMNIGLGGGYGYNWCLPHRSMIHGSLLPTVNVVPCNKMTIEGEHNRIKYAFPEVIVTERFALVHYFNERHFANLTFVNYTTIHGSTKQVRIIHDKWRLRVCYGLRF